MNLPVVRAHGLVNYFDDQRFGNLAHDQGWIARELMLGRHEQALRTLLAGHGPWESAEERHFKNALAAHWGDWRACRDDAGRFGAHHSVFEHLARHPGDFAGAFYHVATRIRLIHLYAWQSHVWNRAVTDLVREALPLADRVLLDCDEGVLVTHAQAPPAALLARPTFRLPGERLEDVGDLVERRGVEAVLAREGVRPEEFRIEGVSGFKLKGEDRPLLVTPAHLRVRPADDDNLNPGTRMVRVRFELPRGAYATLVVKRLFSTPHGTVRREDRRPLPARERGGRDRRAGAWPGKRPWPGKRQGLRPRAEGPPGETGRRERRGGGGGRGPSR
jgi:tRNA pseudouridine13 synthase